MNRTATILSIAAAFAAGCGVTHLLRPAYAAETITAQVIHTGELEGDAISAANAGGMRNKLFVSVDEFLKAVRPDVRVLISSGYSPDADAARGLLDLDEIGVLRVRFAAWRSELL